jgi:thiol-disulfide isomerase/thioredoxin
MGSDAATGRPATTPNPDHNLPRSALDRPAGEVDSGERADEVDAQSLEGTARREARAGESRAADRTAEAAPADVEGDVRSEAAADVGDVEPESAGPRTGSELDECLQNGLPTMADFGAGWCAACKKMEPVLLESAIRYQGRANIVFVDTDDYPALARQYRIVRIPTQIVFDVNGREVGRHVGYWPLEEIDRHLAMLGAGP